MKLMSVLSLAVGVGFVSSSMADVMDEYRDPKFTGGYIVGEYLFDKAPEQNQQSYAVYGEYDLHENITLYSRAQYAKLKNKAVDGVAPEKASDAGHIAAIGRRLRYRFGQDDRHEVGVLLTLTHRDFNEINGETYRVMPYTYLFSGQTFSARAHVEFDFINKSAWNADKDAISASKSEEREVGLYLRANVTNMVSWLSPRLKPDTWSISYEDKLASDLDDDAWGISHEHTVSWDHVNGWSVIVAQQKTASENTANINPFKRATKAGYTTLSLKRQF